ncbi:hypothetical protein EASAB2608_01810 [Streptomyces sp. EAS-AB2608]|nr:hypothetical protein EASAB2608_01810 [Streptomyces sp. EAS-AB2608]
MAGGGSEGPKTACDLQGDKRQDKTSDKPHDKTDYKRHDKTRHGQPPPRGLPAMLSGGRS